jgi:hypothetical protein
MCESAFEELQESLAGRARRNRSEEVGERLTPGCAAKMWMVCHFLLARPTSLRLRAGSYRSLLLRSLCADGTSFLCADEFAVDDPVSPTL